MKQDLSDVTAAHSFNQPFFFSLLTSQGVNERKTNTAYHHTENRKSVQRLDKFFKFLHAKQYYQGALWGCFCMLAVRSALPRRAAESFFFFFWIQAELNPHFDVFWMLWEQAGK